jgi:hypothetical protein
LAFIREIRGCSTFPDALRGAAPEIPYCHNIFTGGRFAMVSAGINMKKMKDTSTEVPPVEDAPKGKKEAPEGGPREGYILVPCRRCKGPLYFPTGYEAQHRPPVMFCRKCGAQTKLPLKNKWIYVVIGIVIFVAAWIVVILTVMKDEDFMP